MSDLVTVSDDDGLRTIRLANPARRNVLDMVLTEQLADAIVSAGPDVRAIVLLAEGDHFCVGGDVGAFGTAEDPREFVAALAGAFHRVVRALQVAVPVVVGFRGWAAGAGMSLVLAADVVVAGESASLRPAYPGIGVTPDGGMSWTLPRLVGPRRAAGILIENRVIPAVDALALGIADRLVADDDVDAAATAIARQLVDGPRAAYLGIKKLVAEGLDRGLSDHLDAEAASIAERAASAEGLEGIHAFLERRAPNFRGVAQ